MKWWQIFRTKWIHSVFTHHLLDSMNMVIFNYIFPDELMVTNNRNSGDVTLIPRSIKWFCIWNWRASTHFNRPFETEWKKNNEIIIHRYSRSHACSCVCVLRAQNWWVDTQSDGAMHRASIDSWTLRQRTSSSSSSSNSRVETKKNHYEYNSILLNNNTAHGWWTWPLEYC